jgi:DNA-binding response OmpR family regulator
MIKKNTILIIEDEISLRNALRDKFTRKGFYVFEAKDGELGLTVALREHPSLILLDIIMPKMDGMTMFKKLRQEKEWGKNVPIILLSNLGADDENMMKEIIEDKLTCYLVKSDWSLDNIVTKVKEKLSLVRL